ARRSDAMRPSRKALEARHGGRFIDARPALRRGPREADPEAAHVHLGAPLLQQPAVESGRIDLAGESRAIDELHAGIDVAEHLESASEAVEMLRLRGELELPGAHEVAVDRFLADDLLDRVDRRVEVPVHVARFRRAEA